MSQYLTTKELAELLRIKERKVYDLAASGEVPCSRAMGKLLFPRKEIDAWLSANSSGPSAATAQERPAVFLGSHDPLLEWALRQSHCDVATFFDSSMDGLKRFSDGRGIAAGLHVFDPETADWNVPVVRQHVPGQDVVLMEWAQRRRGLIVRADEASAVRSIEDVRGRSFVPRQADAGSQHLFEYLSGKAGITASDLQQRPPALTEGDAAVAVLEGEADIAFGLEALAHQYRLGFVPLVAERFDLLIDRRAWFDPPLQIFLAFCRTRAFLDKAASLPGYDISGFGRIHFNA